MEDKENTSQSDVTQQNLCSRSRSCCLEYDCNATFLHLSGGNYVFSHCGCDLIIT